MKPERIISETGAEEDVTSLVLSFIGKSCPIAQNECEDTCASEGISGVLGPLPINARIKGRIVRVNPDEHFG